MIYLPVGRDGRPAAAAGPALNTLRRWAARAALPAPPADTAHRVTILRAAVKRRDAITPRAPGTRRCAGWCSRRAATSASPEALASAPGWGAAGPRRAARSANPTSGDPGPAPAG